MRKKIIIVGGARPNFIKIAPLVKEFIKYKKAFEISLVHTGQHYDFLMSEVFFRNLQIPKPNIFLNVGSASHSVQTAKIMIAFEEVILKESPDIIIVVGDVNSTLACSLVASKLGIKVAHVEAGLRSFDRSMPEEINRIITDSLSNYLFVSEASGLKNLKEEGVDSKKVFFVGNIMIDTLLATMGKIDSSDILTRLSLIGRSRFSVHDSYAVLTLHRPSNVDSKCSLAEIYDILKTISRKIKIIYPVHPRSKKMMNSHNFLTKFERLNNLLLIDPLGYIDFIKLIKGATFALTDSGGIQEETTFLKISCLTMRENTERPVTVIKGTNYLVGRNKEKILEYTRAILTGKAKRGKIPELWDGKTAQRIVEILIRRL